MSDIADLARKVADEADMKMSWNYDTLECAALRVVRDAFESLAHLLDLQEQK